MNNLPRPLQAISKTVILTATLLLALTCSAADVQFRDGLLLYVGRPETRQAIVTGCYDPAADAEVSIPASVSAGGVDYDVVGIGQEAFQALGHVTRISIPATVFSIGDYAFRNCTHLAAIDVAADNADFSSEGGVLFNKNKAWLIAFPQGLRTDGSYTVPSSVKYIDKGAFHSAKITGINLPSVLESIGDRAFYSCSELTAIDFPSGLLELGEEAFGFCRSLTTLKLSDRLPAIPARTFMNCYKLAGVTLPQRLRTIGAGAFSQCEALTEVELPASLDSLAPGAFSYCKALTQVNVAEANARFRSVGGIVFDKVLAALMLYPAGRTDSAYTLPASVTAIGEQAFYTNRYINNVSLPQQLRVIGDEAFRFCSKLKAMQVPDGVTAIGAGAFQECINMEALHLPTGLTEIADRLLYMSGVERLYIPAGVRRIGQQAFYLSPLMRIDLPDAVEEIDDQAFFDIAFLRNVRLGPQVRRIGSGAFAQCSFLQSIVLGPALTEVDYRAFFADNALADVFSLNATPPTLEQDAFTSEPSAMRLYVPMTAEEKYASAPSWGAFTNRRGISYKYLAADGNMVTVSADSLALLVPPHLPCVILSSRWQSDDPTVAPVDSLGLVRAVTPGTTSVWYLAGDTAGTEHRVRCQVTVVPAAVDGIDADEPATPLPGDGIYTLSGQRVSNDITAAAPGVYIVRRRGKAQKLMITAPR